ncbi:hypothetical protein KIM372_12820 [Bombiscardovia nodaiensis]|uniref:Uncharacterized protein n=1 Tax=Bombiscardovia nodaiensis TaxID=2932181 RepID=A0ABM8B907_9BIFI|nr:hypothetical protein KIM372_12820 [Bombiscardovia nodaiensis]
MKRREPELRKEALPPGTDELDCVPLVGEQAVRVMRAMAIRTAAAGLDWADTPVIWVLLPMSSDSYEPV